MGPIRELGSVSRPVGDSSEKPSAGLGSALTVPYSDAMAHEHAHRGHSDADGPGEVASQTSWDERYRSSEALWSGAPNPQLVTETAGLSAGAALDVGCGEGADAIWLAERGWQVTAVDFSSVALERGAARAFEAGAEVGRRITWLHADLTGWVPAAKSFDLVSAQFLHLPREQREPIQRRIADAVAPGGILLVVGHHPSDLQTTVARPSAAELLLTATEIAAGLVSEDWVILVNEDRPRQAFDPDGRAATVHDAVLKAQRAP